MEESQIAWPGLPPRQADTATRHSIVGDVTNFPFEDGSFDVAHCHAVLMHVPDTQAVLTEVTRVLKSGAPALQALEFGEEEHQ